MTSSGRPDLRSGGRRRIAGRRTADRGPARPGTGDAPVEDLVELAGTAAHGDPTAPGEPRSEPAESAVSADAMAPATSPETTTAAGPDDDAGTAAGAEDPEPDRTSRGRELIAALAILLVVTLGGAGLVGAGAWQARQAEQSRSAAVAAARTAAEAVLSYDYRQLDKSFSEARALLTPEFAADFDKTAKVVGEQATKTRATVRAEVREVGVTGGDADRMTVLVFVNQTTTSAITRGTPRVDLNRARFTMVRGGEGWQVRQIDGL